MSKWSFWDYHGRNSDPIEEWYQSLSVEAKLLFDNMLKTNQKTELPGNWVGFKRFLKGKNKGIWELAFKADRKQYRVLGIFDGEVRKKAILLIGCFHKDKRYTPPNALGTALARATEIKEGRAESRERKIKTDI